MAELLEVASEPDAPATISVRSDVTLSRSGRAMRLVQTDGSVVTGTPNRALIKLVLRARRWWAILRKGEVDISTLAASEGVQSAYITRVLRLAFLAPAVVNAILAGTTLPTADATALTATSAIDLLWSVQIATMLPDRRVAGLPTKDLRVRLRSSSRKTKRIADHVAAHQIQ